MRQNVGSADSFIRFLVGTAFLLNIIILEPSAVGTIVLLVLGCVFLATAGTHYCPLYSPLGICTTEEDCLAEEAPATKE